MHIVGSFSGIFTRTNVVKKSHHNIIWQRTCQLTAKWEWYMTVSLAVVQSLLGLCEMVGL